MLRHWSRIVIFIGVFVLLTSLAMVSRAQESPAPRVWSISADTSTPTSLKFTVRFSESVSGVDVSDFVTAGDSSSATITTVNPADIPSDTYIVTVALTSSTTQLALALFDDDSITNVTGLPLGGIGASNGNAISTVVAIETPTTNMRTTPAHARIDAPLSAMEMMGHYTSIALSSTNIPIISYQDASNNDLKLAICNDAACTSPSISTLDSTGNVGLFTSIALTAANIPVISYQDASNNNLKLAVCNNAACTSPSISTLDSDGDVGQYASIALTSANIPVISYLDVTNNNLKLAICNNATCTSPTILTLDSDGDVGKYASIALTSANIPVISYFDETNADLKLAICDNTTCTSPTISTIDSGGFVGEYSSIALTSANIPVISYLFGNTSDLKLAVCNNTACTSPTISTIDSIGDVGYDTSIALSSANVPVISYLDITSRNLKLAVCDNAACTSPTISTIDSAGDVGYYSSIALTSADIPVISYFDFTNGRLKLYTGPSTIDNGQPNTFNMSTPTANQRITTTSTTLTWTASTNATGYEYCYTTSITACSTWISSSTSTSATITGLTHNTTYYWQVRATNGSGTTIANGDTMRAFTVVLPPTFFAKSSPTNNAKNQKTTVTLKWAASTRATKYEYCIALSTRACTNWKSAGTARQVTVRNLAKNKTYFWQVRAKNTGGTTLSTTTYWKFTTAR